MKPAGLTPVGFFAIDHSTLAFASLSLPLDSGVTDVIDIHTETILSAKQACSAFPKRVSLPTLWRWMLKGSRGVVLESIRIGGRRYTTAEACSRFIEATAERFPTPSQKKEKRSTSLKQAKSVLDQFGV